MTEKWVTIGRGVTQAIRVTIAERETIARRRTIASRETIASRQTIASRETIAKTGLKTVRVDPLEVIEAQQCICWGDRIVDAVSGVAAINLCLRLENLGVLKVLEALEKKY